jgi:WD40 repeat protein
VLTTSNDGVARLWDLKTGEVLRRYPHKKTYLWDAVLLPGEKQFLTASDEAVVQWDLETGGRVRQFKQGDMVFRLVLCYSSIDG